MSANTGIDGFRDVINSENADILMRSSQELFRIAPNGNISCVYLLAVFEAGHVGGQAVFKGDGWTKLTKLQRVNILMLLMRDLEIPFSDLAGLQS